MNLRRIAESALAEVATLDGGPGGIDGGGWLTEHDQRYHGGHFDPVSQRCSLRDRLGLGDNADRIGGTAEGGGASSVRGMIGSIPDRTAVDGLIRSASEAGLLDEQTSGDLRQMLDHITSVLSADDENAQFDEATIQEAADLNDVYAALNAAMGATAASESQSPTRSMGARVENPSAIPWIPEATAQQSIANASQHRLSGTYRGESLEAGYCRENVGRRTNNANCWKTAAAYIIRKKGFAVIARKATDNENGSQIVEFKTSQLACADKYERIGAESRANVVAKLDAILADDSSYPEHTFIMCWSGGHATVAEKVNGRFKFRDAWHPYARDQEFVSGKALMDDSKSGYLENHNPNPIKTIEPDKVKERVRKSHEYVKLHKELFKAWGRALALTPDERSPEQQQMLHTPAQYVEDSDEARFILPEECRQNALLFASTRLSMMNRDGTPPTDEQVLDEIASNGDLPYRKLMSSFIIKPQDPIIPEMFMLVKRHAE